MWSVLMRLFGGPADAGLGLFLVLGGLVLVALLVALPLFGLWRVFGKCGETRWHAVVPFYNVWRLCLLTFGRPWPFWAQLGCQAALLLVPQVGLGAAETPALIALFCAQLAFGVVIGLAVARSFESGPAFGVGVALVPSACLFVLGLDGTGYLGPGVRGYFGEGVPDATGEAGPGEEPSATEAPTSADPEGACETDPEASDGPSDEAVLADDRGAAGPAGDHGGTADGASSDGVTDDAASAAGDAGDASPVTPDQGAPVETDDGSRRDDGAQGSRRPLGRVWVRPSHR